MQLTLRLREVITLIDVDPRIDCLPTPHPLSISKSQMTHLIDKLISLGIVARVPDTKDRRIINISLTDKGRKVLEEYRRLIRENIERKLSYLKHEELEELSLLLRKLRDLESKIE